MRKIRYYLTLITLLASLSGFTFLGAGSLANTASLQHISASSVAGKSTQSVARLFKPPCPGYGSNDC